jgi:hypothetical protein
MNTWLVLLTSGWRYGVLRWSWQEVSICTGTYYTGTAPNNTYLEIVRISRGAFEGPFRIMTLCWTRKAYYSMMWLKLLANAVRCRLGPHPDDQRVAELSPDQKQAFIEREIGRRTWQLIASQEWYVSPKLRVLISCKIFCKDISLN